MLRTQIKTAARPLNAGLQRQAPRIWHRKASSGSSLANTAWRPTSFSLYTAVVAGGLALTGTVVYFFISETLLPDSDVQLFERAFNLLEHNVQCQRMLGGPRITAFSQRRFGTPIHAWRTTDRTGRNRLYMNFRVQGQERAGLVRLEMVQSGENNLDYRYLVLEVEGFPRYYLINNAEIQGVAKKGFLGVQWGK